MKTYEISYTMSEPPAPGRRYRRRRVVVNSAWPAKNGIDAIRTLLADRLGDEFDPSELRTLGSNKRATLHGITFEANLVRAEARS